MIAAGIATTLTGFYFLGKDEPKKLTKKKNSKRKKKTIVTRAKLIAFTKDFKQAVKHCRCQVTMQEQQILMNAQRQGIDVPPLELHQHLSQFFTKSLKGEEQKLYTKHCMDATASKNAAEKYKDDPEYIMLTNAINKQYSQITTPPSGKPASSLDLPKLKKVCGELLKESITMWDEIEANFKKKKQSQTEIFNEIQHKTQDVTDALFEKFGIDKYTFEASIKKYMTDPEIRKIMINMQQVPQQRLRALGLSMQMQMPKRPTS